MESDDEESNRCIGTDFVETYFNFNHDDENNRTRKNNSTTSTTSSSIINRELDQQQSLYSTPQRQEDNFQYENDKDESNDEQDDRGEHTNKKSLIHSMMLQQNVVQQQVRDSFDPNISMILGASQCGKSSLAFDLAYSIVSSSNKQSKNIKKSSLRIGKRRVAFITHISNRNPRTPSTTTRNDSSRRNFPLFCHECNMDSSKEEIYNNSKAADDFERENSLFQARMKAIDREEEVQLQYLQNNNINNSNTNDDQKEHDPKTLESIHIYYLSSIQDIIKYLSVIPLLPKEKIPDGGVIIDDLHLFFLSNDSSSSTAATSSSVNNNLNDYQMMQFLQLCEFYINCKYTWVVFYLVIIIYFLLLFVCTDVTLTHDDSLVIFEYTKAALLNQICTYIDNLYYPKQNQHPSPNNNNNSMKNNSNQSSSHIMNYSRSSFLITWNTSIIPFLFLPPQQHPHRQQQQRSHILNPQHQGICLRFIPNIYIISRILVPQQQQHDNNNNIPLLSTVLRKQREQQTRRHNNHHNIFSSSPYYMNNHTVSHTSNVCSEWEVLLYTKSDFDKTSMTGGGGERHNEEPSRLLLSLSTASSRATYCIVKEHGHNNNNNNREDSMYQEQHKFELIWRIE